ncbi:MAG: hypothetical protein AB7Y46_05205 [Armatimonadota bacterium]
MSEHAGWVIAAAGRDTTRRFEAPVQIPGCRQRPWVLVRPLTAREALRRESLGLREELLLDPDGAIRSLRRTYDHEAMVEYELERCLVDFALPATDGCGRTRLVRKAQASDALKGGLLDRLPVRLIDWLMRCLDEVNLRRPADAEVLAEAKKA